MIFCPPAAAAATIIGLDVTIALPAEAAGEEPGVRCTTITDGRFGADGRNICGDEEWEQVEINFTVT